MKALTIQDYMNMDKLTIINSINLALLLVNLCLSLHFDN